MTLRLRVGFSLLFITTLITGCIPGAFAETTVSEDAVIVTLDNVTALPPQEDLGDTQSHAGLIDSIDQDEAQPATTTNEVTSEYASSSLDSRQEPVSSEVGTADAHIVELSAADVSEEPEKSTLQTLSTMLADYFEAETEENTFLIAEVIPVYELDEPIWVPVVPQKAVVVEEESESFIEKVVDGVRELFTADTEVVDSESSTTSTSVNNAREVTDETQSAETQSDSLPIEETPEAEPATQQERGNESVENTEAPISSSVPATCRWWQIWCALHAYAEEIITSERVEVDVTTEVESSDTTMPEETIESGAGTFEDGGEVVAPVEQGTSTHEKILDEVHEDTQEPAISATSSVIITPLISLGTTSISGELIRTETGAYHVVIPPGGIPIGIHELVIATTTADGEINERVVIDYGGGLVTEINLDSYGTLLITTNEAGEKALWLWQESNSNTSVLELVPYGEYPASSPIGLFDEVLFYLSLDGRSMHGYDLVSGTSFSHTIEDDRRAVTIPLRSGRYHVAANELDFQFVSVVDALY